MKQSTLADIPVEADIAIPSAQSATASAVSIALFLLTTASCGFPRPADVGGETMDGGNGSANGDASVDAAAPSQFLSCSSLATTCGPGGDDSCCHSIEIPGGSYDRSYDLAGDAESGNTSSPATVSTFRLDKYEVTVGRFRAFVNAGMGTQASPPVANAGAHPKIDGSGWDVNWNANLAANTDALVALLRCDSIQSTWTDAPAANEHRPISCITWFEAMAFCAWDGGHLPTEAEWNYAASGGDDQRAYPWSNPASSLLLDSSRASYGDGNGDCLGDGMPGCAVTDYVAVGTKPTGNGRWGHSDLAGNVFEWVLDGYTAYPTPCIDCAELADVTYRVFRSGAAGSSSQYQRSGHRVAEIPTYRVYNVGVRCARAP
jgi:formylglycine-generating enzyme